MPTRLSLTRTITCFSLRREVGGSSSIYIWLLKKFGAWRHQRAKCAFALLSKTEARTVKAPGLLAARTCYQRHPFMAAAEGGRAEFERLTHSLDLLLNALPAGSRHGAGGHQFISFHCRLWTLFAWRDRRQLAYRAPGIQPDFLVSAVNFFAAFQLELCSGAAGHSRQARFAANRSAGGTSGRRLRSDLAPATPRPQAGRVHSHQRDSPPASDDRAGPARRKERMTF